MNPPAYGRVTKESKSFQSICRRQTPDGRQLLWRVVAVENRHFDGRAELHRKMTAVVEKLRTCGQIRVKARVIVQRLAYVGEVFTRKCQWYRNAKSFILATLVNETVGDSDIRQSLDCRNSHSDCRNSHSDCTCHGYLGQHGTGSNIPIGQDR